VLALFIGFLPSALMLGTIPLNSRVHFSHSSIESLRVILLLATVMCCIIASAMLFKRGTAPTVLGGIGLLFLNAFVALAAGCDDVHLPSY